MRSLKRIMLAAALALAALCAAPAAATADSLESTNNELAQAKAELELAKVRQEQAALASGEEQRLAAAKSLLDAQAALKKAKVTESLATLSAFQAVLGPQQALTKGGEVSAAEKRGPFLLWTKNGGAYALSEAAGQICAAVRNALAENSPKLLLLPAGYLEHSKLAMRLDKHLLVLEDAAKKMTDALKLDGESAEDNSMKMSGVAAAVITAASLAQYGLSAVSSISKSLRTDRELAEVQGGKERLFQTLLFRHPACAQVVERVDTEAHLLEQAGEEYRALGNRLLPLRNALEKWNARKAGVEDAIAKTEAKLDKAKTDKDKALLKAELKALRADLAKVAAHAGTAGALKELLGSATPEVLMQAAEAKALAKALSGRKGLVVDTWTQDLQVYADNAWAKSLRRSATVSAEYRVVSATGEVTAAGFYGRTTPEQKIDWKEDKPVELFSVKEPEQPAGSKTAAGK